ETVSSTVKDGELAEGESTTIEQGYGLWFIAEKSQAILRATPFNNPLIVPDVEWKPVTLGPKMLEDQNAEVPAEVRWLPGFGKTMFQMRGHIESNGEEVIKNTDAWFTLPEGFMGVNVSAIDAQSVRIPANVKEAVVTINAKAETIPWSVVQLRK